MPMESVRCWRCPNFRFQTARAPAEELLEANRIIFLTISSGAGPVLLQPVSTYRFRCRIRCAARHPLCARSATNHARSEPEGAADLLDPEAHPWKSQVPDPGR